MDASVDKAGITGGRVKYNLPLLNADQMRRADQRTIDSAEISGVQLMENAGSRVADAVLRCAIDTSRVVLVAGPGNNGGDAFAAARFLRRRNIPVTVVPLAEVADYSGDAAMHVQLAREDGVKIRPATAAEGLGELKRWLTRASVVVDAIFGTGLVRQVEGHLAEAITCINESERPVLSVDIASGIDASDGRCLGTAIQARWTLPIAAYKWGHWLGEGAHCCGQLLAPAPIGINEACLKQAMVGEEAWIASRNCLQAAFGVRPVHAHKGDFGHVWVFGGSVGFSGAPQLAAQGALAAGAGLVSLVCDDDVWPVIATSSLEVMVHPRSRQSQRLPAWSADALVVGPGWGLNHVEDLTELLSVPTPVVLDADALNTLSEQNPLKQQLIDRNAVSVITPHPGEAARLLRISTQQVQQDRKAAVKALAQLLNCWVVLKGRFTLLGSPAGEVVLIPFGSSRLATAGTGDVLAGVVAAVLAKAWRQHGNDMSPDQIKQSVAVGVALHGMAGEQDFGYRAGQLVDQVAALRQSVEKRQ